MKGAAALLAALLLAMPGAAWPQATTPGAPATPAACPAPGEVEAVHLYGLWLVEIEGQGRATLLLERSIEYAGGFSGAISRDGVKSLVAGDVDEGRLSLEESDDGRTISAVWDGAIKEGSCAREITGTWRRAQTERTVRFTMRRAGGWS